MSDPKIGRLLKGVDMDAFWYCLALGGKNKKWKTKGSVDQVKLYKKYKKNKEKKNKVKKEKNNG